MPSSSASHGTEPSLGPPSRLERDLVQQPATRALLLLARPTPPPDLGQQLGEAVDWDAVLALAASHRVMPHVARSLRELAEAPEAVRAVARAEVEANASRHLVKASLLARTLEALGAAGVPSLPLKGPALSMWLYGDPGRRTSADLDVWVPLGTLTPALAAVRAAGFEPVPGSPLRDAPVARVAAEGFQINAASFVHAQFGVHLELHWRLFNEATFRVLPEALAAGFRTERPAGHWSDVGPPAAAAAYVLVHGALHGYRRLTWLVDAAALATTLPEAAWEEALRLAEADGVGRAALLGPYLAHRLLGAPVPPPARARMQGRLGVLRQLADGCLTRTPDQATRVDVSDVVFRARLRDRRRDRVRAVWDHLTVPSHGEIQEASLADDRLAPFRRRIGRVLRLSGNVVRRMHGRR